MSSGERPASSELPVPHLESATDTRSVPELVEAALWAPNEEARWQVVGELHRRGTREAFKAARALLESADARDRELGADILGQLGSWGRVPGTFQKEAVVLLRERIRVEEDPDVLYAACVALGHRRDPQAIPDLAALRDPPNADVRFGVVFGLLGLEEPAAIQALVDFTSDSNGDVRDWATFDLGTQIEVDTPEIREALLRCLDDEEPDVRHEAIAGLAKRGDARALEPLLRELRDGWDSWQLVQAAKAAADPRLLPELERMREPWQEDPEMRIEPLEAAIAACRAGGSRDDRDP